MAVQLGFSVKSVLFIRVFKCRSVYKCITGVLRQFPHCIYILISMIDYDCWFTVYCYFVFTWPINNSHNMGICGLPDIYTLVPRACGPCALGI